MAQFPSMKAGELMRVLQRAPLGYEVVRQKGSHRVMAAPDMPQILFSAHDGATLPPGLVRKMLTGDVGLSEDEALDLIYPGRKRKK
ncbi:type II toxin-antitoxin system HicA family toxin [Georgenia sp. MJ206]|uniref:type II toxin-antitoxin system HicA family toxin n=1 Tax=Georgenia wangjunii TaxID=3117730 RepID=UPI002F265117